MRFIFIPTPKRRLNSDALHFHPDAEEKTELDDAFRFHPDALKNTGLGRFPLPSRRRRNAELDDAFHFHPNVEKRRLNLTTRFIPISTSKRED